MGRDLSRGSTHSRGDKIACALLAVSLLAGLAAVATLVRGSWLNGSREFGPEPLLDPPAFPFAIKHARPKIGTFDYEAVDYAIGKLRLHHNPGLSLLLHSAAIDGLSMPLPDYPGPAHHTLETLLLDSTKAGDYFEGDEMYSVSHWGLRSETQRLDRLEWQSGRPAHDGQLLREFARHGLPLSEAIKTKQGDFEIYDLSRDVIANLSLSDAEIEWNTIALMLYFPSMNSWTDKFGNPRSYSELAEELMDRFREPEGRACHGIHCLEALAILLQVDEAYNILEPACKDAVREYLTGHRNRIVASQSSDGSWSVLKSPEDATAPERAHRHLRVHVTGHHIDWLLLLPQDLVPRDEVFRDAARFLLNALVAAESSEIIEHYCPYSHAAYSLQLVTRSERG